ncbi:MAG: hypothetical protein KKB81_04465 [Candidatus Margulisbacteria bacterium]|nr:hypothetical protein [Candidatus Margulisiibacteriota bacterium]MBU1022024.1 hypothetical protein [Candidatus Margulisiibacteriota bacterium]MBU1729619.1 hypothetical protein [Candidatus Margulisiibacteriota bacterium]MBU1954939.1 hypothetical protein [Candidatus Margulisiibacteriota bacterium]
MKGIIRKLFSTLLSEDMGKQARQVEIITLIVFIILLIIIVGLWQFQIVLTAPGEAGREIIGKMNIFQLLLSR